MAYPRVQIINSNEAIITAATVNNELIRYLLIDNIPAAYCKYKDDEIIGIISTYYKPSNKALKNLFRVETMAKLRNIKKVIFTTDPNITIKHVRNYFTK